MTVDTGRRNALLGFSSVALGVAALAAGPARAETGRNVVPQGAHALSELMERLRKAPRRRDWGGRRSPTRSTRPRWPTAAPSGGGERTLLCLM